MTRLFAVLWSLAATQAYAQVTETPNPGVAGSTTDVAISTEGTGEDDDAVAAAAQAGVTGFVPLIAPAIGALGAAAGLAAAANAGSGPSTTSTTSTN